MCLHIWVTAIRDAPSESEEAVRRRCSAFSLLYNRVFNWSGFGGKSRGASYSSFQNRQEPSQACWWRYAGHLPPPPTEDWPLLKSSSLKHLSSFPEVSTGGLSVQLRTFLRLVMICSYISLPIQHAQQDRARLVKGVHSRVQDKEHSWNKRLGLDMKKHGFHHRTVTQWKRWLTEVTQSPSPRV